MSTSPKTNFMDLGFLSTFVTSYLMNVYHKTPVDDTMEFITMTQVFALTVIFFAQLLLSKTMEQLIINLVFFGVFSLILFFVIEARINDNDIEKRKKLSSVLVPVSVGILTLGFVYVRFSSRKTYTSK